MPDCVRCGLSIPEGQKVCPMYYGCSKKRRSTMTETGLDPRVFIELRKLESQGYRKGFREGVFWAAVVIVTFSGILLWVIR